MMCLPLCVSQFCCTLNSKGISRVWGVTYWIQSLQERLEPMGDELSLLCAAALRGAFWKQVTDDFQISCQPRFPPKSILFVAALALKALCTSHPFFFCLDEANPGLAPGFFLLGVLCMTGERWKKTACVEGTKGLSSAKGSLQPGAGGKESLCPVMKEES